MKRATPTPNRFIISIPSWPVKALVILLGILVFVSCDDELAGIGIKKPVSRFKVYYREFDIPATTVQTDSINTSLTASERVLCGVANDPIFGKSTAVAYMQFAHTTPSKPKIDQTNKTDFQVVSVDVTVLLGSDYYIYGDTTNTTQHFSLHKLDPYPTTDFWFDNKKYISTKEFPYNSTPLANGLFNYNHEEIKAHRKANIDPSIADEYDTINFSLQGTQLAEFGEQLLDTARAKGVYSFNDKGVWEFDRLKTDSVFRRAFPGFAIVPAITNNKIFGFKTVVASIPTTTRVTLKYSFIESGTPKTGEIFYFFNNGPAFSNIQRNRDNTGLVSLTQNYTDFNAPDDYCYLQSGNGVYAKLDFSSVRSYFDATPVDTLINIGLNGAELLINAEPKTTRYHIQQPQHLYLRMIDAENHFYKAPLVQQGIFIVADPAYTSTYFTIGRGSILDVLDDKGRRMGLPLTEVTAGPRYYSGFLTEFFSRFLQTPDGFEPIINLAVIPGSDPSTYTDFGKSFDGVSFKKDKVKLRIYYTKAL